MTHRIATITVRYATTHLTQNAAHNIPKKETNDYCNTPDTAVLRDRRLK